MSTIATQIMKDYPLAYSIQHHVIKFVSDLRQFGGFLWVLQFPPPIKPTAIAELLLKVALNTITLTLLLSAIRLYFCDKHITITLWNSNQWCTCLQYFLVRSKNKQINRIHKYCGQAYVDWMFDSQNKYIMRIIFPNCSTRLLYRDRHGDHMVVGFITTYAISAYHH